MIGDDVEISEHRRRVGHLILDQETFRRWLPEARALEASLVDTISNPEDAKRLAIQVQVIDVEWSGAITTQWQRVLERAAELKKLRDLVDAIRKESIAPGLKDAIANVDGVEDLGGSLHPQRMLLEGPKVFLGRPSLREHLPQLQNFASPVAILVVRGDAGTGRTWTQSLLSDRNADRKVYSDENTQLKATMRAIWKAAAGAVVEPPASHTTEAAGFIDFWNDVCTALVDADKRLWVLFDDLDKGGTRSDVLLLAETLAMRMVDATFQQRIRLVMLGYPPDRSLSAKIKLALSREDKTHAIDESHVGAFIDYCCAVKGKNVGAAQITQMTKDRIAEAKTLAAKEGISVIEGLNLVLLDWYGKLK